MFQFKHTDFTNDEKRVIGLNFIDLNFVDKVTGNNILHLLAMLPNIHENVLDRVLDGAKEKINDINNELKTPLVPAIKCCNIVFLNKVEKLMKSKKVFIDMDKIIKGRLTYFSYACFTSNYDIIIKVLEMGSSFNKDDLGYITNKDVMDNIVMIFLDGKYTDIRYKDIDDSIVEFKIYDLNDFIIQSTSGEGTYGVARIVMNKQTGRECILKEFKTRESKNGEEKLFINRDSIKDITFLRSLNRHNEAAAKIYGIIFSQTGYYIVLEKLDRTWHDHFRILSKYSNNKVKYISLIKKLLKESLICIDRNSDAGIIHCDLKSDNMMIDGKGKAKFIDYGFSSFLGISGNISLISHTIHEGSYVTRDGSREGYTKEYILDGQSVQIPKGYIGFNYDIASLGLMFIQGIFGHNRYISHNGILYVNKEKLGDNFTRENIQYTSLVNNYGQEIVNILMEMIEVNPNIRKTAKELLSNHIFDVTDRLVIPNIELTNLRNVNKSNKELLNNFRRYNTITSDNYKRCGFNNYDGIIETYQNDKFYLSKDTDIMILAKKFIIDNMSHFSLETIFNGIAVFNELNYKGVIPKNETSYFYMLFLYNILRFYTVIYDDELVSNTKELLKSSYLSKYPEDYEVYTDETDKLMLTQEFLITLDTFYILRPIMSFYGYIKFILQAICTNEELIREDCNNMISNLYRILVGESDLNNEIYTLYDIMKYCHYMSPNHIEIDMKPSFLM